MLNQSGIYQIRNTVNGKIYIGSATTLKRRWAVHRHRFIKGKHHSTYMQRAWNKHGAESFVFEPLITCAPSMLIYYEQQFIDQWNPEYNTCRTAGSTFGRRHTEATKLQISKVKCAQQKATKYTANGATRTLAEWAEHLGAYPSCFLFRLNQGMSLDETFSKPSQRKGTATIAKLKKAIGVNTHLVRHRLNSGWSLEKALNTPNQKELVDVGEAKVTKEAAAKIAGVAVTTIRKRMNKGMTLVEAVNKKSRSAKLECFGEFKPMGVWAAEYNMSRITLARRLKRGLLLCDALTTPRRGKK